MESSEPRESQISKSRIENLSDLVFGLALSIGSIVLIADLPQTPTEMVTGIGLFASSFLIIIWIWTGYTRAMASLSFNAEGTFACNLLLLFCVALEPYTYYVTVESGLVLQKFASSAYAIDLGAMMMALAGLKYLGLRMVKRDERKPGQARQERFQSMNRVMVTQTAVGVLFFVSALPFFWVSVAVGGYLRYDIWYILLGVFFVVSRPYRPRHPDRAGGTSKATDDGDVGRDIQSEVGKSAGP
jgi:uncharacterized membrane protein